MSFFVAIYLICSIFVFFYAISKRERLLHGFSLALAINVFPLAVTPYMSMDEARLGGIPLAYFPIIAAGFAYVVRRWNLVGDTKALCFVMYIFVMYITFNAFYQRFLPGTVAYYLSWIVDFLIYLSVFYFFSRSTFKEGQKVIKIFFVVISLSCIVGILRYFVGLSPDANFMPMVNRNGTVVFLVMVSPLLFYLFTTRVIGKSVFLLSWVLFFATLLLMQSRSGILGFIFVTVIYFVRWNAKSIALGILSSALILSVFIAPIDLPVVKRLTDAQQSIAHVYSGEGIEQGQKDYARYMLLKAAWTIFENNPLFGAGIGVPNYRAEFAEHVNFFHRNSKSHNFYMSYLAELGIIGFSWLIFLLSLIYRALPPLSSQFRAFKVSFMGMALMMTMNEYILLPELWFFFGMLGGIGYVAKRSKISDGAASCL